MAQTKGKKKARPRRSYSEEFKQEAVQMLLDGHSAPSVAERLGLSGPNVLYSWKRLSLQRAGRQRGLWVIALASSKMSCGAWNASGTS